MNYWLKLVNILCIMVNSITFFVGAAIHNYWMTTIGGLFVILASTNILNEDKSNDENQTPS